MSRGEEDVPRIEKRLTEFYKKPIEEIDRIEGDKEVDWGEPVGAERSDFQKLLDEQLKDPEFRAMWKDREKAPDLSNETIEQIIKKHQKE